MHKTKSVIQKLVRPTAIAALGAVLLVAQHKTLAFIAPSREPLPDFDHRIEAAPVWNIPSPAQASALTNLQNRVPDLQVEFDPITKAPRTISAAPAFLTGENGQGKAVSPATLAAVSADDPYRATKAFLAEHQALFGHGPEVLTNARIKREFTTPHNGLRTVVWEQQQDGLPLFESLLVSHTTKRGELVNLSSQFLPYPVSAAIAGVPNKADLLASPPISARAAVGNAARLVGETIEDQQLVPVAAPDGSLVSAGPEQQQLFRAPVFKGDAEAKLIWLPMSRDRLRLCWDVTLMGRSRGEMFRVLADSESGEILLRRCLTSYISDVTYRVYTSDSPSPFSPAWSTPSTNQPPIISRSLITLSALDTNASPSGWIDDGGNETRGNNVDAHTDRNADNLPDLPRPQGSPPRVFDFALDLTQSPASYTNAAVVQLFYWNNFMHDRLYQLGFTEAAGNFQSNNFGRGGLGNDAVQADAQDGSGVNNANFSTPADGSAGRMQMYIFTGVTPNRDGDLDAEVILHEYTHGLSNRRVGNGVGISALQPSGMGEGWSDFYAQSLLSEAGDNVNAVYAYGGYVTYLLSGLTQNYYFGIRRYPYCTDTNINPLTFKDIDPAQASTHTGIPRSPIVGSTANEVHNMGEVWCVTLWQARANLIAKYGWAVGNQLILQLVTDGMNLSPANPTFLQARDAILQADQVDNGGANLTELWAAFAKRGMGKSATSPASSTTSGLVEAYDIPFTPLRLITPTNATEGDGLLVGAGQVQIPFALGTNVTISLSSSKPSEATVPATVSILAGQTNAAFDITIVDDALLDGTQPTTIAASAPGFGNASTVLFVADNETATLQVSAPATVTEGQGTAQGTILVSAPPASNVAVSLLSSDLSEIQVPASVIIPAGQTSAVFTVTVVDDALIDGPQTATITAHVQNWTDGSASLTVLDNESLNLSLVLPATAAENAGVLSNAASVRISGALPTNLVVSLSSGATNKLLVPNTATISAGNVSAAFNLTMVDNAIVDSNQPVTITATAPGFIGTNGTVLVLDDDSPPYPSNPRPGDLATNVPANTNLSWFAGAASERMVNGDFESGTLNNWVQATSGAGQFVINNGTFDPPSPDGPLPPFAGTFSALGTETGPGIFSMYQDFSIPAGAPSATLSWAHRMRNFYTSWATNQQVRIEIRTTNNVVLATPFTTQPGDPLLGDWVQKTFDLTPYAGQNLRFAIVINPGLYYLNAHLDSVSVQVGGASGGITNDVYFGTNPTPGLAEYAGTTTNATWSLPLLAPLTTYYWQIVAKKNGVTAGPIWRFTTAGLDHFSWASIASPQVVNQPFNTAITAQDAFNRTVTNFTGTVRLQGTSGGNVSGMIEDFESGIWPHSPWINRAAPTGAVSSIYAHDGNFGLNDLEWAYRTDVQLGKTGDGLSWWMRFTNTTGRAYLGFGASASGCWSIVAAPNTSQLIIQTNPAYGFSDVVAVAQTWQAGKWYKLGVQFTSTSSVTCSLYDSDGTTVLNSISTANVTGLPNGIAMRAFNGTALDTITSGSGSAIAISPTNSGNFVQGVWNGNVTVLQTATNMSLRADDGNSHMGSSNPFDVVVTNDLSIAIADLPDPVSAGSNLTYTLTVANSGPSTSTDVRVTNTLPPNVSFVSASSSQGACNQSGALVTCNLGSIPGGTNATITIVVVPTLAASTLTNRATVSRAEPDPNLANNTTVVLTTVNNPLISIADASVVEGNSGVTNITFSLTLNTPSSKATLVTWATANGSASAGSDYVATNGTVTLLPGVTSASISVLVLGDTAVEPDETFFLNLSNPGNAGLDRSQATGTIVNDDGTPGQLDHFAWKAIPSPQFANLPFPVAITALDAFNNPATNPIAPVSLRGLSGAATGSLFADNFEDGDFSDWTIGSDAVARMITNGIAAEGTNSFTIIGGTLDHYQGIWHALSNLQPFRVTFRVRSAATNLAGGYVVLADAANGTSTSTANTAVFFYMSPAGMGLVVDTGNALVPWTADQWYKISLAFNWTNHTVDYSVDDVLRFAGVSFRAASTAKLSIIHLYNFNNTQSWWDDIQVGSGTAPAPLAISPVITGSFSNSVWTGNLTVLTPATNAVLIADDLAGHTGTSNPFNVLSSNFPPGILVQPANTHALPGCSAAFSVLATGTVPLSYQWFRAGSPLNNETNSSLMLSNLQTNDFTTYSVTVSNVAGTSNSSPASLSMDSPPVAGADTLHRPATGGVKVLAADLLANDSDTDGDTLAIVGVSSNSAAGAAVYIKGSWVYYLPPSGFTNTDSFSYTVSDGHCATANGMVSVLVSTDATQFSNFRIENLGDGSFRLSFAGIPGRTYRIQYTDSPLTPTWIDLATNTGDPLGQYEYVDHPPPAAPVRFYRSVSP